MFFIEVFGVGDDIDIRVFLQELEERVDIERVIFIIPERRHKIIIGKSGRIGVGGDLNVGISFHDGVSTPPVGVMGEYSAVVGSDIKIDFKEAMSELIIEEKSFARISIRVTEDSAESVSDIGICGPTIIKFVRGTGRFRSG